MQSIGIRREDKNEWERRAPLTPEHVSELVEVHGVPIAVQPSTLRAFADRSYQKAGARIDEDLSGCAVVLGVKEIPLELLLRSQSYLYFSHTSKGQDYNMPMLHRLLELGCTLIDYERIVDSQGRRLIFFGRHAGYAGMINTLWALGRSLARREIRCPIERVRLAHDYSSLDKATHHISRIGEQLRQEGLPERLGPIVCGLTGSGNVTQGAQEIYERLPAIELDPDELVGLADDPGRSRNVLYFVRFSREQRYEREDGGTVDADEISRRPALYRSGLTRWLPHLTLLVHGAFWQPPQPRLVTRADLRRLWSRGEPKLRVIADISCDIDGAIEATVRATTPGDPVYRYDVESGEPRFDFGGRGPLVMAVDNLPCQLPTESSQHFGDGLLRFVPTLARCDWSRPVDSLALPREMRDAVIVHRGQLAPAFRYLTEYLDRGGSTV